MGGEVLWRVGALLALLAACGRSELAVGPSPSPEADGGSTSATTTTSGGGTDRGGGVAEGGGPSGGGGAGATGGMGGVGGVVELPVVAYAQTKDQLFTIDPLHQAQLVGALEGCDGKVTDVAMRADGTLYVVSLDSLFTVFPDTGQCVLVGSAPGAMPNSLTFLPPGVLAAEEQLVGYKEGRYLRLDLVTAEVTQLGDLGVAGWSSSGDLIWYWDRLFLSVSGVGCDDCLVEVDVDLGFFKANVGDLGAMSIFGLAQWGGDLYGFTGDGLILQIDVNAASATPVSEASMPWLGATSIPSLP